MYDQGEFLARVSLPALQKIKPVALGDQSGSDSDDRLTGRSAHRVRKSHPIGWDHAGLPASILGLEHISIPVSLAVRFAWRLSLLLETWRDTAGSVSNW